MRYPRQQSPAYVVEGLADALGVRQHLPLGAVTLTAVGVDITGTSHEATHCWLAGRGAA